MPNVVSMMAASQAQKVSKSQDCSCRLASPEALAFLLMALTTARVASNCSLPKPDLEVERSRAWLCCFDNPVFRRQVSFVQDHNVGSLSENLDTIEYSSGVAFLVTRLPNFTGG